ncbi:MAG: zinc ribbon domain-containing protein, partial [Candidatus Acidiferrum sp.]
MQPFEVLFADWKPVSRASGIAWLVCYSLFLIYALTDSSGFLFLDYVNLIIHEGGHLVFSPFGYTITILGGTLGELLAPLLCGLYFFWQREVAATAFCSFWFFENF